MLKTLSVVGLFMMTGGVFGLWTVGSLFSPSPVVIGVQLAAVALMVWARVTFGRRSFHAAANPTEGGLVTTGPYRFIRHPIYTAICVFAWAGVAAHLSVVSAALGALVLAGGLVRMLCEEPLVAAVYPEYRDYARKTKRMIPFVF
jgi:protein-S-isoprenylcysteine O-methyltransferase Ste14